MSEIFVYFYGRNGFKNVFTFVPLHSIHVQKDRLLQNHVKKFKDTKRAIRSRKSKKDRHYNGQKIKNKKISANHYTEN